MFTSKDKTFADRCLKAVPANADSLTASRAREFFYINVVKYYNVNTCEAYKETDGT
jgi:hypothetical protein